ncbi:MAG: VUT family protein, partial [Actinomycetes bacterium]
TIAFYGVITGWNFVNYVVVGYLYKTFVEVLLLPVTYNVIKNVKKREASYSL